VHLSTGACTPCAEAGPFQDTITDARQAHDLALASEELEIAQKNQERIGPYDSGEALPAAITENDRA